jgi:hypothetical protein
MTWAGIVVTAARRQQVPGMRRRCTRRLPGDRQPAAFSEVLEKDQRDHVARLHQHRSAADARSLARRVVRVSLALCHAPQYQSEHKESLAQDWAHVPIPKSRELFDELVAAGEMLAVLLNPVVTPTKALVSILGDEAKDLAVPGKVGGGNVGEGDLLIEHSFFGGAQGGWRARSSSNEEPMHDEWGYYRGPVHQ